MRLLVILAFIVLAYSFPVERKLDEKFIGRWQLDKSENFDELLAAKGVSWFVRKMILMSSVTKTFQKNINTEDRYDISVKAGSKNVAYEGVKLGEEFKAKGMDGEEHLITFDIKDGDFTEKHVRLGGEAKDTTETYHYTMDGNQMLMTITHGDVTAKRWFDRDFFYKPSQ